MKKMNNGLSTAQGSTAHVQDVLKIENFVPYGMRPVVKWRNKKKNRQPVLDQVLKAPKASELSYKKEKGCV